MVFNGLSSLENTEGVIFLFVFVNYTLLLMAVTLIGVQYLQCSTHSPTIMTKCNR